MPYGRSLLSNNQIFPTRVSADNTAEYKHGGASIDWSTVSAAGSDVTLPDGSVILSGQKYLRYGQVMTRITTAEVQTVDLSGGDDPTAGTWDMTIMGKTITGIAWNVSAASLQSLIRAEGGDYLPYVTVSKSGFVYTITFPASAGNVAAITVDFTDLTSATAVTITTTTAGVAGGGLYGPYDSAASDGRQTLTRGECFILDETQLQYPSGSSMLSVQNDRIGGLIEGGAVYFDRILQAGGGSASLAAGPTYANLVTAFPRLNFVRNS